MATPWRHRDWAGRWAELRLLLSRLPVLRLGGRAAAVPSLRGDGAADLHQQPRPAASASHWMGRGPSVIPDVCFPALKVRSGTEGPRG